MSQNAKKYIVSVAVDGVATSQIWDSSRELRLGYRIPWKLVRQDKTSIEIRHDNGERLPYQSRDLGNRKGIPLPRVKNLPRVPVYVSISEIDPLRPAFLISPDEALEPKNGQRKWRVYETTGDWVRSSHDVSGGEFAALQAGTESFRLIAKEQNIYRLQPLVDGVKANGQELKRDLDLASEELAALNVEYGTSAWRFQQVWADDPAALPIFTKKDPDPEGRWFRRITLNTALACLLLVLITFILGRPKPEEKLPPVQFARLVLQQLPVPDVPVATAPKPESTKEAEKSPIPPELSKKDDLKFKERRAGLKERNKLVKAMPAKGAKDLTAKITVGAQAATPTPLPALSAAEKLEQRLKGLTGAKSPFLAKAGEKANAVPFSEYTPREDGSGKKGSMTQTKFETDRKVQVGILNKNLTGALPSGEKVAPLSVTGSPGEGGTSFLSVRQDGKAGGPTAEGLTKEEVWSVIRKNLHEIRFCYETNILRNPKLQGKMVVGFTIDGNGAVLKPKVEQSEINDTILNECILARVGAWKFPVPKGNINVDVKYPFIFRRL